MTRDECDYIQLQPYCFTWYIAQKQRTKCRLAPTYKDALILKWGIKYTGLWIIAGYREEIISLPNE